MWTLGSLILLLCCSGLRCHDCNQTQLYFKSSNFFNLLHWDEVHIPGQEVLYSVQYKKYGESVWSQITGCQQISVTSCDLSSVMMDVYEKYYAMVTVNSTCVGKYMAFVPSEKTVLEAPEVSISVNESSLTVILSTPKAPQNSSIRNMTKDRTGKPHINYEVQLTLPGSRTVLRVRNSSGVITFSSLRLNTEYCGTAFYMWTHPSTLRQSENTTFCAMLPGKPWMDVVFIVSGSLALLLLISLGLVLCHQYVMRKQRLPDMLKKMIANPSDNLPYYTDPKVKIDIVRIYSESPREFDKPDSGMFSAVERAKAGRNGGSYAAQDCCDGFPLESNSYVNQPVMLVENSDSSNVSATSYSMVVTSLVLEDQEDSPDSPNSSGLGDSIDSDVLGTIPFPFSVGCGEPLQDLNRGPGLDKKDFINKPVVLPVLRGEGGKLEFLATSTPMANSSDILQVAPGLPPAGERTPLLTDLITVDETESSNNVFPSDYGRAFHSNYVQQNFPEVSCSDAVPLVSFSECPSNYRQNWVLGIPLESHLSSIDCTANTEPLTELDEEDEEEEVEDPLSRLGAIFLDGWVVQIPT